MKLTLLVLATLLMLPPYGSATSQNPTLAGLRFMSGCWEGTFERRGESGVIEEHYTTPSSNVMLGTTRYLLDGRTVQYEFTAIIADSTGIMFRPYPGGVRSPDDFRLTDLSEGRAVFESPEHDYPKRIIYRVGDGGSRIARIDGGADDPEGTEWKLRPAECHR